MHCRLCTCCVPWPTGKWLAFVKLDERCCLLCIFPIFCSAHAIIASCPLYAQCLCCSIYPHCKKWLNKLPCWVVKCNALINWDLGYYAWFLWHFRNWDIGIWTYLVEIFDLFSFFWPIFLEWGKLNRKKLC